MDQAEKLPPWICRNCSQRLENAYDFIQQARKTHELWLQKLSKDCPSEDIETATLECLRETPIQLLDIEGITIKMEEPTEPVMPSADPTSTIDPLIKKSNMDDSSSDDEDDDVPLKQRRAAQTKFPRLHKCNKCDKAFKYVTNLFRHKQRDHSPSKPEEADDKIHQMEPLSRSIEANNCVAK